jgi:hypothetical protein
MLPILFENVVYWKDTCPPDPVMLSAAPVQYVFKRALWTESTNEVQTPRFRFRWSLPLLTELEMLASVAHPALQACLSSSSSQQASYDGNLGQHNWVCYRSKLVEVGGWSMVVDDTQFSGMLDKSWIPFSYLKLKASEFNHKKVGPEKQRKRRVYYDFRDKV